MTAVLLRSGFWIDVRIQTEEVVRVIAFLEDEQVLEIALIICVHVCLFDYLRRYSVLRPESRNAA